MKKEKPTKAQQTKEVRTILNRFSVDLSEVQVSTSGTRIALYGTLMKRSGEEFQFEALNNMLSELERIGYVTTELTNWDLNSGVRKIEK